MVHITAKASFTECLIFSKDSIVCRAFHAKAMSRIAANGSCFRFPCLKSSQLYAVMNVI